MSLSPGLLLIITLPFRANTRMTHCDLCNIGSCLRMFSARTHIHVFLYTQSCGGLMKFITLYIFIEPHSSLWESSFCFLTVNSRDWKVSEKRKRDRQVMRQSPISFIKNVPRTNGGWAWDLSGDQMNSERQKLSFRFGQHRSKVLMHIYLQTWEGKPSLHTFFERKNVPMSARDKKKRGERG